MNKIFKLIAYAEDNKDYIRKVGVGNDTVLFTFEHGINEKAEDLIDEGAFPPVEDLNILMNKVRAGLTESIYSTLIWRLSLVINKENVYYATISN